MNIKPPAPNTTSLIERAAQAFDFGALSRKPNAPVPPLAFKQPAPTLKPAGPSAEPKVPQSAFTPQPRNTPVVPVNRSVLQAGGFIVPGAPPSALSEEYRIIKRAVMLAAFGGVKTAPALNARLIMVCSGQPNEGKTFTSVNLALSLAAEQDVEVVLVDVDVAKPEILSTLGLPGDKGIMDALADPALNVEQLIIPTDIPNLKVLPAGRAMANDTELLASAKAQALLQGLIASNPRRIVLLDSAPVLAASAAAVLAHLVGHILMVVRADHTSEHELRESLGLVQPCPLVNLILNNVSYSGNTRKYGSYYGLGD